MRERLSLETSRDSIADELLSTQKQLQCELKWKDTAEITHKQLLLDKRELSLKVTELEDSIRDKNHHILELECKMNRLQQENRILEEKSLRIFGHSSPISIPLSPIQVTRPLLYSTCKVKINRYMYNDIALSCRFIHCQCNLPAHLNMEVCSPHLSLKLKFLIIG